MTTTVTILGAIWFFTFLCSVCAITFAILWHRHAWAALLMAALAISISVMGLTGRTPLGRLPDVAWSWTNDSFLISMRLGSAFVIPLVLAIVGTATLLVRNKGRLHGA
ncbi:MAG TPA: hypothetical protein VFE51_02850 [Verrucomicrobiae bacterium]|nr:hypothetical protein [Verrucomicrobiae bacterium]